MMLQNFARLVGRGDPRLQVEFVELDGRSEEDFNRDRRTVGTWTTTS